MPSNQREERNTNPNDHCQDFLEPIPCLVSARIKRNEKSDQKNTTKKWRKPRNKESKEKNQKKKQSMLLLGLEFTKSKRGITKKLPIAFVAMFRDCVTDLITVGA
jgi:ribosomal protein L32E